MSRVSHSPQSAWGAIKDIKDNPSSTNIKHFSTLFFRCLSGYYFWEGPWSITSNSMRCLRLFATVFDVYDCDGVSVCVRIWNSQPLFVTLLLKTKGSFRPLLKSLYFEASKTPSKYFFRRPFWLSPSRSDHYHLRRSISILLHVLLKRDLEWIILILITLFYCLSLLTFGSFPIVFFIHFYSMRIINYPAVGHFYTLSVSFYSFEM